MTTFFFSPDIALPVGQGGKAEFGHFLGFLGLIPKQKLANPSRDSAEKNGPPRPSPLTLLRGEEEDLRESRARFIRRVNVLI